jgi:dihydroorotate dehydrogenase subfamily 1
MFKSVLIGDVEVNPSNTNGSGCVMNTSTIVRKFALMNFMGMITTKSIGPEPHEGNLEAIVAQIKQNDPFSWTNAVGLGNPGKDAFSEEMSKYFVEIDEGSNTKINTSVFAADRAGFEGVVRRVAPFSHVIEGNFGCPHSPPYGSIIGSDVELVYSITEGIVGASSVPVVIKLTPNVDYIGEMAIAAVEAGASAIAAINTVTPIEVADWTGSPTLWNGKGGQSGRVVKQRGLECCVDIAKALRSYGDEIPIIAGGGIIHTQDARDYKEAIEKVSSCPIIYSVGTGLRDINDRQLREYYEAHFNRRPPTKSHVFNVPKPFTIDHIVEVDDDLREIWFNEGIMAKPGQFVFAYVPGVGEKPFSIANDMPLALGVRQTGLTRTDGRWAGKQCLTAAIFEADEGDQIGIRGAYGTPVTVSIFDSYLVLGGTGGAPGNFLASRLLKPITFLGGKTESQLLFEEALASHGELRVATDDGSKGFPGNVVECFEDYLENETFDPNGHVYVSGPEIVIRKTIEATRGRFNLDDVHIFLERQTECGVGYCGHCEDVGTGTRTCVNPLPTAATIGSSPYKRNHLGELKKI